MAFVAAPDALLGDKYRLTRRLADGGMGSLWVARHVVLDAEVAVKLMSPAVADTPNALARFEREAKASAQLKSKHIVRVHDYGVEDGSPFMVMELLEGEDLGQRLKRVGRLSLTELAPIFTQICRGLEVAHEAGLVHRDLKPGNVFLARDGDEEIVKLLDFGIARETKTSLVEERTSSGVVVGSPHHMSPEQAQGDEVDHRSDLWSLGVLVFRAVTGAKPFDGDAMGAVLVSVLSKPIPKATARVESLPPAIDEFVARALCRNVDRRFQHARLMAEALEAITEGRDAAPLLDPGRFPEGREEETIPSAQAVAAPSPPGEDGSSRPSEGSLSRAIQAVTTTGAAPSSTRSRVARMAPWIAVVVAVGVGGFVYGRAERSDAPAEQPSDAGVDRPEASPGPERGRSEAPSETRSDEAGRGEAGRGEAGHGEPGHGEPGRDEAGAAKPEAANMERATDPKESGSAGRDPRASPPPVVKAPPPTAPKPAKPEIDPFTGLPTTP